MSVSSTGDGGRSDQLVAAALSVLNTDPTASMARVAAAAGVGRATLHRHFASRDDLIREIGDRSIRRWETSLHASGVTEIEGGVAGAEGGVAGPESGVTGAEGGVALRAALEDLVARYVQDAGDFGFALTNPEIERHPEFRERCLALIAIENRVFTSAQRAGVLRDDVPAEWIGHVLFGLLRSAIDARHYGTVAPRLIPALVADSFFSAVGR